MILGAIALLVLALVFVAAEIFLPSHGVLTIFAICAAMGSIVMAFKTSAALGALFALVIMVASPFVIYITIKMYPKTPVGRRVMLANPSSKVGFEAEASKLEALVGQQGVAVTLLRPGGEVEVAGQRVDAVSEDEVIEAGMPVEVVRVSGLKVLVKAAKG